ncbi:hypothetical protein ACQP2Y_23190 [Actinoplanes sp. CA-051413]|uniref:hypothetical protein n=1 Tax=Actinoplanes sp. CA-051413 TaxID=3239899 RepID=UPI003D996D7A
MNSTRSARLAVLAGATLAGVGAVFVTAAPAQAAVVDVAVAAAPGVVAQSATATCPAGQYLTGAAGGIVGAGKNVTLTDVIPDLATNSVTVWGHTNPGGAPGFSTVAQAICRPGAPPAGYYLEVQSTGLNADPTKAVAATCQGGTRLLGTGAEIIGANGQAFYRSILPNFALTSNTVTADAAFGFAGSWELIAYAICGTPPGVGPVREAQSTVGGADPVNAKSQQSSACPAGTATTGVGGSATATAGATISGYVFVNQVSSNLAQDTATAEAVEGLNPGGGVSWYLSAYDICWAP